MKHMFFSMILLTVLCLIFVGCDNGVSGPGGGQGKMIIYLTDAPGPYAEVNIQIDRVEVHSEEHGWRVVNSFDPDGDEGRFNLLVLTNGVMEVIGEEMLDAGVYTQVRLVLTNDNNLVLKDGTEHHLFVPSGEQTGLKIHHTFEILNGETYELLLDFDAHHSIVEAGQSGLWLLKPVIRVQSIGDSGSLAGKVEADNEPVEGALVRILKETGDGEEFVASSPTNELGDFSIVHIAPGDYLIEVVAEGFITKRLENEITVEIGITKDLGVITLEAAI